MNEPPYFGNGPYCYANSLGMCLAARATASHPIPEASFLECLTTMPFGVMYLAPPEGPKLFFSPPSLTPDGGLERARQALNWSWECVHARGPDDAVRLLADSVRHGPVLAGPIDLGLLSYNPSYAVLGGSDHYVAVLGVEGDRVRLHDPQGYPQALLPLAEFLPAWRADRIAFPHHAYSLRRALTPGTPRDRATMIRTTMPWVAENLRDAGGGPGPVGGVGALRSFAAAVEAGLPDAQREFHTRFSFPLGARRSADASEFMREAGHPAPAALFREKARRLGAAQYAAVHERWTDVSRSIGAIVELEEKLLAHLGGSG